MMRRPTPMISHEEAAAQKASQEPIGAELIAKAIIDISAGMKKVLAAGLKYEAIVTLVAASSGVPKSQVRLVINNLDQMKETYCSK